jgi:N-acetylneuraminate synthase
LSDRFQVMGGLSDHTLGIGIPIAAVALGAVMIEKHFTLARADGGVDAAFSLEPDEMAILVKEARRVWSSLGQVHYGPVQAERGSLKFRRSLYIVQDMKAGEQVSPENLRAIRPGFGLAPKHFDTVLGRRVRCDVPRGTPLDWNLLE